MNKKNEILAAQLGAQIRLSKFNEKVTQKIVDLEGKVEKQIQARWGVTERKIATNVKLWQEELNLTIKESETQAARMREDLENQIGVTNNRVDKVNEDLERYRACVDARMHQQTAAPERQSS